MIVRFYALRARLANLCLAAINPLDIAVNAEGGTTSVHTEGEVTFADMLQLPSLFAMLKRDGLLWSTIVVLFLLATMLFIKKSDKLAERKADILHKLFIAFLISSCLWIVSALVKVFDIMF